MNKSKLILSAIGGVFGVLSLAMAFLVWSAISEKNAAVAGDEEEGTDGLETVMDKASTLSRKAVYPCAESIKAIEANGETLNGWKDEALTLARSGDRFFPPTTPAAFKEFLIADARRLAAKPGAVNGVIVKPDFAFGPFRAYIAEGMLPQDKDLPILQRRWDDIAALVETLVACNVSELVDIQVKSETVREDPPADTGKKSAKKAKRPGKGAQADEATVVKRTRETYGITFTTRPAGFIKCINALETGKRFQVVEDFSLVRAKDAIGTALQEKTGDEAKSGGFGRRPRHRAQREAEDEGNANVPDIRKGVVTDPVLDDPITVTLTVSIYDFGSLEGGEEQK